MGNLLFIDSDDINSLSDALKNALERRGIVFRQDTTGEFGYPMDEDDEPDIDPNFGVMPKAPHYTPSQYGGCGGWANEVGYGGCGGHVYSSCGGGSCGKPSYGGCGRYSYPRC